MSPFATVQAAIEFAAAHATIDSICVAGGIYQGPAGDDLALADGVTVYGGYEASGWTRVGAVTTLEPATELGVVFGPDIVNGAGLDGVRVRPFAAVVTAAVTVNGAQGVVLAGVQLLPLSRTDGDALLNGYGLDVSNGASVSARDLTVGVFGGFVESVGVRSVGSELVIAPGTNAIDVTGVGNVVGAWIEDSPGSRIEGAAVSVEWDGDGLNPTSLATGVVVLGDAEGVVIESGRIDAMYGWEQTLGIDIRDCEGRPRIKDLLIVADVREQPGLLAEGIRAVGDCQPEIVGVGVDVFGGDRGSRMIGVNCESRCSLRDSGIATASGRVEIASRVSGTGVLCDGCDEVVGNVIVGISGITNCFRNCEYTAIGLRVRGSATLVDKNSITAGVGGGPIGIDSGYLYGIIASGTTRIQNNFIDGGGPSSSSLGSAARTHGISLTGPVEVHSNSIHGGDPNTSACGSPAIWLAGANSAIIRNNILYGGPCGMPVEESWFGTTPSVAENNAFNETSVLWRDYDGDNPLNEAELNAMPDLTISGNFVAACSLPLSNGSPCVNTGTPVGAPFDDHYGDPRSDGAPDVGPDECADCALDPCASNPCEHGGTCTNLLDGDYQCACLPSFSGKSCETVFTQLSASDAHTCGLRSDGTVACWGLLQLGVDLVPAGTSFGAISTGLYHSCGIRLADHSIVCWGSNSEGQASPPAGAYTALSSGRFHSCALRSDGAPVCWGVDNWGNTPSPPSGSYTSLGDTAGFLSCAIGTAGTLACFGQGAGSGSSPPAGTFLAVGSGFFESCGLRTNGELTCWDLDFRQALPPVGAFESLGVGFVHACAARSDGTLACWGEDSAGETTPPSGNFQAVASGQAFSCAIRSDSAVVCWGANNYGQLGVP